MSASKRCEEFFLIFLLLLLLLLSCFLFSGPGVNKAVLLQLQQEKEKARRALEMKNNLKQAYENISYEDTETKQEPDSSCTEPSKHVDGPSKMKESEVEVKEERIDRF